ncbi:MAG: 8-amino-7-oxononanoate synthase [Puniceicoccales bacterium]|jgi:8-amino-7-oxononanoate synthase|nr:8-amino-7-oxononanoate synthase [Puniceicoccales bacterium]
MIEPHIDRLLLRVDAALQIRRKAGTERLLVPREVGVPSVNLAGNDYLGLAGDPALVDAAREALACWGCSASASPLVGGYTRLHAGLETALAAWHGFPHALVWNSGYAANSALLGILAQGGDLVLADRLIHNSMVAGILKSGARFRRYRHCDLQHLEALLAEEDARQGGGVTFVATESVFSMDGDSPDMARLAALREQYGFVLVVDEAHATGWYGVAGAGLAEAAGVARSVDLLVGTLGKALGSQGAYVLCRSESVRRYLLNFAGEFVYSTYLAPASAAAALAAVRRVQQMGAERAGLHALSRRWRAVLRALVPAIPDGDSPIVPIPIGDASETLRCARVVRERGFELGAIRPPTVPAGSSRLRVSLRRGLGEAELARFAEALSAALGAAQVGAPQRILFVGGWGISPEAQHRLLQAHWPRHAFTVIPPVRAQLRPMLAGQWDAVAGYSLGAWLLAEALQGQGTPARCVLLCPFRAFPAEAACGGRVSRTQVRYLARWLQRDARGALADFYQRAGLSLPLPAGLPYAMEDLQEGLACLCELAPVDLPPGARIFVGGADALIDYAALPLPDAQFCETATHDLQDYLALSLLENAFVL